MIGKTMKRKTSVSIDEHIWSDVEEAAQQQRRSVSSLVNIWLEEKTAKPVKRRKKQNGAK